MKKFHQKKLKADEVDNDLSVGGSENGDSLVVVDNIVEIEGGVETSGENIVNNV